MFLYFISVEEFEFGLLKFLSSVKEEKILQKPNRIRKIQMFAFENWN